MAAPDMQAFPLIIRPIKLDVYIFSKNKNHPSLGQRNRKINSSNQPKNRLFYDNPSRMKEESM
ncbi:hypothetical protein GD3902_16245 [Geobacillus thermodenitrificans]|nr:hypothetical protein GD3902_16245 [Geobacillus thermodenitrificans]